MKRSLVKTLIFFTITLIISAISQMLISATSNICISGSNIEIEKGTTKASITIDVSNNPGIAILGFDIGYNAENLELTSVIVSGEVFSSSDVTAGDISKNPYVFSAFTATDDITKNGLLVTLEFAINPNCQSGIYAITLTNGEAYNINEQTIGIEFVNGKITIKPEKTYTINYDANSGSNAPAAQTKIHDVALALSNEIPTKEGYNFMGWATSKNGSVAYAPGASFTTNADTTLYAVWKLDAVSVTGVSLDKTIATLTEGENLTLTATVSPEDATNKTVTWTSSDDDVASVSNGVVTAKKAGKATITATAGEASATCIVTVEEAEDEKVLTFKVGEAKAVAGRQVKVTLDIENNPGIAGMVLGFDYNKEVMTLVNYECGEGFDVTTNFDDESSENPPVFFTWVSTNNYVENGTILTLVFEIAEDAPLGDCAVTVSCPDVVTNQELEILGYSLVSGKVTVVDSIPGDINNDGAINVKDAVLLAQHLANWTVKMDELAADCNADGTIDVKDAILLAQYLARWTVTLG